MYNAEVKKGRGWYKSMYLENFLRDRERRREIDLFLLTPFLIKRSWI